ncbi:MAG TPA: hypothetical protein VHC46_00550 [Thermodesulfobacteriota bacterium]|nr:hypothetical protein [Thermodesulfobacteriota bacterium]
MRSYKCYLLAAVIISLAVAGCNKKPEYGPGSSVQGFRAAISKILFSPIAFDGATVAVEGIVAQVKEVNPEQKNVSTEFKLVDLNGNFINVDMPGSWEIADNDYIVVGGIYRRNGNILEAEQFEKIELQGNDKEQSEEIKKRDSW